MQPRLESLVMTVATCPACGSPVAPHDRSCAACSGLLEGAGPVRAGTEATTHLTPDAGIQAYPQPYPAYPAELGPFIPGRHVVQVVAVRGTWACVLADGAEQVWVEGGSLLPPIGAALRNYAPTLSPSAAAIAPNRQAAIEADQIIGAVGALGMIIGALVTWTQIVSLNAFKFPVQYLLDNKTHSHDPRLGWFIVVVGALGFVASIVRGADFWRSVFGLLGVVIVVLFLIQIARGLSAASVGPFRAHVGFNDIVGGGPWITGIAALVLGISPLLRSRFSH